MQLSIFIVVYPSGGFHSTTLDAIEAKQRAYEIGGYYGELGNVHGPVGGLYPERRDVDVAVEPC